MQTKAGEMATQPANVLITGTNRGLGLEMVKQMMEDPRPVRKMFACCRDPDGPRAEVSLCFLCESFEVRTDSVLK